MRKSKSDSADEEKQSLLSRPVPEDGKGRNQAPSSPSDDKGGKSNIVYYFVYALLNTTMSVPSLYGYASVIFNHNAFQPHIATLSKLVIWSSAVHQMSFVAFSSLSFAKAEVQDAGLLFLSCMTNFIAQSIVDEGGGIDEILSTSIVTLGIATASLGIVLMFLGKFNCANAVSYLPLPVVGGYLAFIGYFCVVAGIGLCISTSMIEGSFITDIQILSDKHAFMLAFPGLMSGLLMMLVARFAQSEAALPMTMVAIPVAFYIFLYVGGYTLDDARQGQWVGDVQPTSSISSLLELVDFSLVRWDLVFSTRCLSVWVGMVFVVSFSSCLDVAAISMDM
jgi:SulP family sulfate permease